MSLKIGITGGIGSGKSVVSRLLHQMGVPVYYSDAESRVTGSMVGYTKLITPSKTSLP